MKNVICLQEFRLKKQLKGAYQELTDMRLLISYGEHERVDDAIKIEKQIVDLEAKLKKLIESDSL